MKVDHERALIEWRDGGEQGEPAVERWMCWSQPCRQRRFLTLRAALVRAQRNATTLSVMFIDLDGFKQCDDRFGHGAGDHVLRVTAQRLRDTVRAGNVVGRLGRRRIHRRRNGTPAPTPSRTVH
jgi:hypothetical protein